MQEKWISLMEYSAKYSVSMSTLRRRIRKGAISFKKEKGKYLVLDERLFSSKKISLIEEQGQQPLYPLIIQEKSQLITKLEEENLDLKNFISILEQENRRLKQELKQVGRIQKWLKD